MSATAEKVSENVTQMQRLKVGQAVIRGRIERVTSVDTQHGRVFEHVIRMPAPDEYSMPAVVEVRASSRLGNKDDDWTGPVQIGGFPRKPYTWTDRNTGETKTVHPVNVTLTAVE